MADRSRREFLKELAIATGSVVLLPTVSAVAQDSRPASRSALPAIPKTKPANWNPVMFNKVRGNAGAIPKSYHASINGTDGVKKHLGKHLPYIPKLEGKNVPEGHIAIMWGDPAKGYAKHPNAPKTKDNPEGHWYNWIQVRKATAGEAQELKSEYSDWPKIGKDGKGAYVAADGTDVTKDGGRNTVYLVALPKDVKKGDTLRIYAHCLTHGEYVDFITL